MLYCYDFICTYKLIDEEFRDILYKQQYLDAFQLTIYDNKAIKKTQELLYKKLKVNKYFTYLLERIMIKYPQLCNNKLEAINILFSYDFFDLFHRYLIDYFTNDVINPRFYKNLIDAIN